MISLIQQALSPLLAECVLNVPEDGQNLHKYGQELRGHQCSQEGKMDLFKLCTKRHFVLLSSDKTMS